MAVGASGTISANNITNQNKAGVKQGSLINAAGDLSLTAEDTVLNRSSDIESEGNISIKAKNLVNKKEIFETSFKESHEDISYKIPHLNAPNYYDAVCKFDRQILTAQIDKETADANIIASGNINIDLDKDLTNHYSKIKAGKNLTVNAGGTVENVGYQGTIHYYDRGNDYHYWKYKKHRRMHIRCRWVYGTTVIPYYDHTMRDEEGTDSERLSLLSGVGGVKIEAKEIVNKTHQAKGKVGDLPESDAYFKTDAENHLTDETLYKEKQDVSTSVEGKADDKAAAGKDNNTGDKMTDISSLHINSKIFKLTEDAKAKYLIETNKKFADYHEFLSSDYLLERVKADPEKVGKRLGDGYFEQQFVLQQISTLTGKKYLGDYGSDMEQFAALMNAGAVVAEEMNLKVGVALTAEQMASLTTDIVWLVEEVVNGEKVLVPEVFLAQVRSEDLRPDGALIVGGEVELYSKQDIKNMGMEYLLKMYEDLVCRLMEKSILKILKTIAKRKTYVIVVLLIVCVILGNQFMKSADEQELRNEAINIIYKSGFSTVIYDMHRDSHYWYTVQVPTSQSCRLINYYNSSLQNKGWIEDRGSCSKDGKIFLKTKNNVKTSVVLKIVKQSDEQTLWRIDVNSWN